MKIATIILALLLPAMAAFAIPDGGKPTNCLKDIDMVDRYGKAFDFGSIDTPMLLLYLNNPDCDLCHSVADSLESSATISNAVAAGRLTVLSVYPGTDKQLWLSQPPKPSMVECMNPSMSLYESDCYDFNALPALFLQDKDGRLLLVDTSVNDVEKYLLEKK